ncbi:MAG TPA: aminoacyl-tRNA hydrolase [Pyrinomonadaceae bacterium]|jgi:PTH1 family peptidyl-tRNA hydrolase|nr:aminoacyl-tRNA hydrolase [Pyrinomonadaceae bacterium]
MGNRQCLIVGLGNPGKEYEWSRHNLGFMLIDKLSSGAGIDVKRRECQALVARVEIEERVTKLVKPQTYMNLSGEAVACLLAKHQLAEPGENLIVISDDLALPFGKIRIRARGSAGGHNGLKSIIAAVGTNEFTRLRIGIQPEHPISDSKRFVLDSFSGAARPEVEKILERSVEALRAILRDGVLKAMTEYNSK